jgi:predicted phage baseplate assembly protein
MTWGRDVRERELTMLPAGVPGGLEPRLLADTREEIRADVAGRASAYTPEWTDRSPQDAGVALVRAHGTLGAAVARRLNRLPRRLAITAVGVAGVRARSGTPAAGLAGLVVAERTTAPLAVPDVSVFLTPAGSAGPALETGLGCHALPGTVASVATLDEGWTVLDDATDLGSLAPFGRRRRPPVELWWGVGSPVLPAGRLGFAVLLTAPTGRGTAVASSAVAPRASPALRWEALTAAGPEELAVERDDTNGLTRDGVVLLRADTRAPWLQTTLPGRDGDPPLLWLRARLVSEGFPASVALRSVVLNGVTVLARRTVRDEVAEPIERQPSGRSRYRLSQVPVLPGTVTLDIAETAGDPFGTAAGPAGAPWREVTTLTTADPDDRVFTLEPGTGILTFGDGRHGRAVAAGYRNVVARTYATGGGTAGLPLPGDMLAPERSVPGLTGATVLALTTGSDAETSGQLLRRGPATIRSRHRAVAASDYASSALDTSGVAVARAHCLPATDMRSSGAVVPGTVTVVVVPRTRPGTAAAMPPMPDAELLGAVADGLARRAGILGTSVVAVAPRYRDIAVTALLVGSPTADLAMLESAARDALGDWFSPLTGGPEGAGWPFGGMVRWDAAVRMLLGRVADLQAVSRLSFRVGNRRLPVCSDVTLAPDELVWPGGHVLETRRGEAS